MQKIDRLLGQCRGQIAQAMGGLIVGVVMLFVGLFMVDAISNATGFITKNLTPASCWIPDNCTPSAFASTQTNLIATTGTVFNVLGLVIIIISLAVAIQSLRSVI